VADVCQQSASSYEITRRMLLECGACAPSDDRSLKAMGVRTPIERRSDVVRHKLDSHTDLAAGIWSEVFVVNNFEGVARVFFFLVPAGFQKW